MKSSRVVESPAPSAFPVNIFRSKSFQCRSFCRTAAHSSENFLTFRRWIDENCSVLIREVSNGKRGCFPEDWIKNFFLFSLFFHLRQGKSFKSSPQKKDESKKKDKWTDIKCDWKIGRSDRKVINCATPEAEKKRNTESCTCEDQMGIYLRCTIVMVIRA